MREGNLYNDATTEEDTEPEEENEESGEISLYDAFLLTCIL